MNDEKRGQTRQTPFSPFGPSGALMPVVMGISLCMIVKNEEDWIENAISLQMGHGDGQIYGFMHLPCRVAVNTALQATEIK